MVCLFGYLFIHYQKSIYMSVCVYVCVYIGRRVIVWSEPVGIIMQGQCHLAQCNGCGGTRILSS